MNSTRRIAIGVAIAVPTVAALTCGLLLVRPVIALAVGIVGIGMLMASETFESKRLAGVGGALAFSGVIAWAILST
jgi:hypothetical protein